jgi:hypothetical protein
MAKAKIINEAKSTAFCYINRISKEIPRPMKVNGKMDGRMTPDVSFHRSGVIAIAPGTEPGTIAVSFFISKPNYVQSPGYMKSAAIGRLNSITKCVQIAVNPKDDTANLNELFKQTKLDKFIDREYPHSTMMLVKLINSFAGAIKNLDKITKGQMQNA